MADDVKADEAKSKDSENQKKNTKEKKKSDVKFSLRLKFSIAIIALVATVIFSITVYIVIREGKLLKDQVFQFVDREAVHLANTAQQSIGVDELALIEAINDLKTISYLKYAFVLNNNNKIIQFYDLRDKRTVGDGLNDKIDRKLNEKKFDGKTRIVEFPDPKDSNGAIYDFSKTVINKFTKGKIGTVVIGLSDIIIRQEKANLLKVIIPISFGFLLIAIIGSVVLASIIIKPIKLLSHGATVIGQGDLNYRIEIKAKDELGQLAKEFNEMTAMIQQAKNKEIESRIMEEQLEMAKDIQEGLNPMGFYDKGGIEIKGHTEAAKGVGGDYFDYIDIDENRVGALISDVSGKGVPASLVMVMIRTVFTSYITRADVDCARVVKAINDSLSADFAIDKFATLFFLIYDRSTEELEFSNAGHGPLFCYRSNLGKCTATKLDGVPIGIMEDVEYKQAKVKLHPNDLIMMYTDGVTEMRNVKKDEYGLRRVQEFILNNNSLNANDFVEKLVVDVDKFRGEANPHDDTTMLVFKRSS